MSTKVGCECIAHVQQSLCEAAPRSTVMSVDGVTAFDLISRESMMHGLMSVAGGGEVLSFEVYGQFSQYFCVFIDDKTQVGNAVGQKPGVCDAMDQVARSPEAKVWRDRHRA